MKLNKQIAGLAMAAAIMGSTSANNSNNITPDDIDTTQKKPPIPRGCKEYFFNKNGGFSNRHMRNDELVFKCVASNDKSARKKFHNWDNLNIEDQEPLNHYCGCSDPGCPCGGNKKGFL